MDYPCPVLPFVTELSEGELLATDISVVKTLHDASIWCILMA